MKLRIFFNNATNISPTSTEITSAIFRTTFTPEKLEPLIHEEAT
jgi:hypothetical protein